MIVLNNINYTKEYTMELNKPLTTLVTLQDGQKTNSISFTVHGVTKDELYMRFTDLIKKLMKEGKL